MKTFILIWFGILFCIGFSYSQNFTKDKNINLLYSQITKQNDKEILNWAKSIAKQYYNSKTSMKSSFELPKKVNFKITTKHGEDLLKFLFVAENYKITRENIEKKMKDALDQLEKINCASINISLQRLHQENNQLANILSNIEKTRQETENAVIGNMR